MVPRRACIQGVLKVKVEVKGHVTQTLVISRKLLLLAGKWLAKLAQTVCYTVWSHVLSLHALTL